MKMAFYEGTAEETVNSLNLENLDWKVRSWSLRTLYPAVSFAV